jgi:TatD DNase family protein
MNLIDTHCHLYLSDYVSDLAEVIKRAGLAGVEKFYLPAIDSSTKSAQLKLEEEFPGKCVAMTGLHPCSVKSDYKKELKVVEDSLEKRAFAAVGEIGLDFYWDRTFEPEQYLAFHQQIEWALHYHIPVILHSRDSLDQTIQIIRDHQNGNLKGIFHCFSGTPEAANQIIELGFYLGIGGVVTYKNVGLDQTLKHIGLQHMVLETDAPYLTPVPFRGKRNESSYLKYVVDKLATIKDVSSEEVANITTENARKIFGRSDPLSYFCPLLG